MTASKGETASSNKQPFGVTMSTIGAVSSIGGAVIFGTLTGIVGFLYAIFFVIKQAFNSIQGGR